LLIGNGNGISTYTGYQDNGESYRFKYYSPGLTFGDPSRLKILKKLRPTIVGANSAIMFLKWAYDFGTFFQTAEFTVGSQVTAYYNENEFNSTAEFTGGDLTSRRGINATGGGGVITIGLEADIDGSGLSLQEINVLALMGKVL
jgi:hypothetical protein